MLMNFSPAINPLTNPYISQDEVDILLEIKRINDTTSKIAEYERRFLNDTTLSELCSSADESLSKQF